MAASKRTLTGEDLVELLYELRDDFANITKLIESGRPKNIDKAAAIATDAAEDIRLNWNIVRAAAVALDEENRNTTSLHGTKRKG